MGSGEHGGKLTQPNEQVHALGATRPNSGKGGAIPD